MARAAPNAAGPLTGEQAEDMLLIGSFVRRPSLELAVLPLDIHAIRGYVERRSGR